MRNLFLWLCITPILLVGCCTPTIKKQRPQTVATRYKSITIELVYPLNSNGVTNLALKHLTKNLETSSICNNVRIIKREILFPIVIPWTSATIRTFEKNNRLLVDKNPQDDNLYLFIACLPNHYHQGDVINIAGLQYEPSSFAIFIDSIEAKYQGSVLLHEFGHILGLTDLSTRKEDPVNPKRPQHCNNKNCTMYWRVQGPDSVFDSACLGDIRKQINPRSRRILLQQAECALSVKSP